MYIYVTVEPCYNEVLGTMKITLLYQVSHYIRVKKTKKSKELGPAKLPCYKRVLLSDLFITRFHCISLSRQWYATEWVIYRSTERK